jgi:ribonuclease HII
MLQGYLTTDKIEAGCDEAGRGCLAGPVFAAAVILPRDFRHADLNDSKKMTKRNREALRVIIEKEALAWAVAQLDPAVIDEINILNASIRAMQLAVEQLHIQPQLLLIDGNRFKPYRNIPHKCIVKGDSKFLSIAAASVLAKTHRDDYMLTIAREFPQYDWQNNKGYPCKKHREGLFTFGITPYHRKSYNLFGQLKSDPAQCELWTFIPPENSGELTPPLTPPLEGERQGERSYLKPDLQKRSTNHP